MIIFLNPFLMWYALILFLLFSSQSFSSSTDDLIVNLPGIDNSLIKFKQYAGYLTVDAKNNRNLFYWFVESQLRPENDPIILWLNGGPGCSSLIGLLSENGPFISDHPNGLAIDFNPYSWNRIANMIFLEGPAGVGFSFSDEESDYNTDDDKTASDNYIAIQQWFQRFPQYSNREFYIAGESYAGHYIPMLANLILEGNKSTKNIPINLKGLMIGNGLTDNKIDINSFVPIFAYHGLIPMTTYRDLVSECNQNYISNQTTACMNLIQEAFSDLGNIDTYNIYAPICTKSSNYQLIRFPHPLRKTLGDRFDPCVNVNLADYLNRQDVRKAIHATNQKEVPKWIECSTTLNYSFSMSDSPSMIPYYNKFIKDTDLKILIYSGDVDSVLPFLGSQEWVASLKRPVVEKWRPWYFEKQVGGWVIVYDKIAFLTVRGAGHQVPFYKPAEAYAFFERYLLNQPF